MSHPSTRDLERLAPAADLRPIGAPWPTWGSIGAAMPGLVLIALGVGLAFAANALVPSISPLVAAVTIGAVASNVGLVPDSATVGIQFAAKRLLRFGIVVLGLQLSITEVMSLGAPGIAVVAVVVAATFFGTQWVGRRLGISPALSLLIATGFSICGASAIAAMDGVADADEEEVAFSIALVTLCGTLSIVMLPILAGPLGLTGARFGTWAGASVHDVAQVVATASSAGPAALRAAVIVKLTRVILLAPMVAGVTVARRRARLGVDPAGAVAEASPAGRRTPLIPLFVAGFIGAIVVRSTGLVPAGVLGATKVIEQLALAAALVALGTGVDVRRLRRIGGRPLLLGAVSWVLVAGVAYAGVLVSSP